MFPLFSSKPAAKSYVYKNFTESCKHDLYENIIVANVVDFNFYHNKK